VIIASVIIAAGLLASFFFCRAQEEASCDTSKEERRRVAAAEASHLLPERATGEIGIRAVSGYSGVPKVLEHAGNSSKFEVP